MGVAAMADETNRNTDWRLSATKTSVLMTDEASGLRDRMVWNVYIVA